MTARVVSVNMQRFTFLVSEHTFFYFIFQISLSMHCGLILMIYMSYDVLLCKDVPFGGLH